MFSGTPIITDVPAMVVTSKAFKPGSFIPNKYAYDGENVNPPLTIGKIPAKTKSLVVIVDDPDAPVRAWTHWIVWNIKPTEKIDEASIPGVQGMNDFRTNQYGGPCPPSGIHHYHFKVYALNDKLNLEPKATKFELEKAMKPYIIGYGELVGLYKRRAV